MRAPARVVKLAIKIADGFARADVECHCPPTKSGPPWQWDTSAADPVDREHVAEALEYLDARGLVKREPGAPHIVSFPAELSA